MSKARPRRAVALKNITSLNPAPNSTKDESFDQWRLAQQTKGFRQEFRGSYIQTQNRFSPLTQGNF